MVAPLEGTRVPSSITPDARFPGGSPIIDGAAATPALGPVAASFDLAPTGAPTVVASTRSPELVPPAARRPSASALPIDVPFRATVGTGAANRPADVRVVQERLRALGHTDVVGSGRFDRDTSNALKTVLERYVREIGGAPERTDRLVPTAPMASWFFDTPNARLMQRLATVPLRQPVGGGAANDPADVRAVQLRLRELGFQVGTDGQFGPQTSHAIRLFSSIVLGFEQPTQVPDIVANTNLGACCSCGACRAGGGTDQVIPGSAVAERLFSPDAPRWSRVPGRGVGFINTDTDNHGYALERTVRVIETAGEVFERYRAANPSAPLIGLNDISTADGRTSSHHTHRNGLDIDIRLPRREAYQTDSRWGASYTQASYDREATYAIVAAFARQDHVERVLFSDPEIIARARREGQSWAWKIQPARGHHNHIHVDVLPPTEAVAAPPRTSDAPTPPGLGE